MDSNLHFNQNNMQNNFTNNTTYLNNTAVQNMQHQFQATPNQNQYNANPYCGSSVPNTNVQQVKQPAYSPQELSAFHNFLFLTLGFALAYTILLYDNFASITMPIYVLVLSGYVLLSMKLFQIPLKKDNIFYFSVMFLLGLSDMFTGNEYILFFNNTGIFLILICMLLHNFCEDKHWDFGKYCSTIILSMCGALINMFTPFEDYVLFRKLGMTNKSNKGIYILIGICIAFPFLFIVTILLYSADAVFANILKKTFLVHADFFTISGVIFTFVFAFFSAYCGLRFLGKKELNETCPQKKTWEPTIAITVFSMVSLVYIFFCVIQIISLFLGKMALPNGYSYAEYAQEGFFQLLFVCLLNICSVLFVLRYFKEHIVLKVLLILISACTYIMVASSAYRMILYIQEYQLTFLRILVLWTLGIISILLAGIIAQICFRVFPLFRYGLVVFCIGYLLLSFSHPDYIIAKVNIAQEESIFFTPADYDYLESLSSDAAPVLAQIDRNNVKGYASRMAYYEDNYSIRKFNFSRYYASKLFQQD